MPCRASSARRRRASAPLCPLILQQLILSLAEKPFPAPLRLLSTRVLTSKRTHSAWDEFSCSTRDTSDAAATLCLHSLNSRVYPPLLSAPFAAVLPFGEQKIKRLLIGKEQKRDPRRSYNKRRSDEHVVYQGSPVSTTNGTHIHADGSLDSSALDSNASFHYDASCCCSAPSFRLRLISPDV